MILCWGWGSFWVVFAWCFFFRVSSGARGKLRGNTSASAASSTAFSLASDSPLAAFSSAEPPGRASGWTASKRPRRRCRMATCTSSTLKLLSLAANTLMPDWVDKAAIDGCPGAGRNVSLGVAVTRRNPKGLESSRAAAHRAQRATSGRHTIVTMRTGRDSLRDARPHGGATVWVDDEVAYDVLGCFVAS